MISCRGDCPAASPGHHGRAPTGNCCLNERLPNRLRLTHHLQLRLIHMPYLSTQNGVGRQEMPRPPIVERNLSGDLSDPPAVTMTKIDQLNRGVVDLDSATQRGRRSSRHGSARPAADDRCLRLGPWLLQLLKPRHDHRLDRAATLPDSGRQPDPIQANTPKGCWPQGKRERAAFNLESVDGQHRLAVCRLHEQIVIGDRAKPPPVRSTTAKLPTQS